MSMRSPAGRAFLAATFAFGVLVLVALAPSASAAQQAAPHGRLGNDPMRPDLCAQYGIPDCTDIYGQEWDATHFWDSTWTNDLTCPSGTYDAYTQQGEPPMAWDVATDAPHYTATPDGEGFIIINDTPVGYPPSWWFVPARACTSDPTWGNSNGGHVGRVASRPAS